MYTLKKSNKKASTRAQVDIRGVKDGILMLSRDQYRVVLKVNSLNFELKSEDEQDALIETYESFLNSLGTKLQILVRTREIDMDNYLAELDEHFASETESIYKSQLQNYGEFISSLITNNKILNHRFYVIVPFAADKKTGFEQIKEQLHVSVDIIAKGLARMGIHAKELSSLEILDLFYSFYSPEQSKIQPLTEQALSLLHSDYAVKGGGV